ncbi:hypothetical protein [Halococcus thailandensis]|uniref:Uncharacterized protein n=1 Tax=Halococcus thailandensis JCM 13552 TaxID=1227457 RepID=M0MWP6_9EURY|nr:hypothetical protein [Halococcus thailandensis]EMA49259.1 hypothetical protein C451_19446 [Halococcus thailandensis JCM 13552]
MSSASKNNDESIGDRLADEFEDRLDPDESVTDMTVDEFAEVLREAGFKTEDEIEASFAGGGSSLTGTGTGPGDDDRLEAFGAGVADSGETPTLPAETRAILEANMSHSSNPEDYGTGVQATGSDRSADPPTDTPLNELTGSADGTAPVVDNEDHPPEAFGTGVAGDTSAAEHKRREEQAEIWARAIEKAEERQDKE